MVMTKLVDAVPPRPDREPDPVLKQRVEAELKRYMAGHIGRTRRSIDQKVSLTPFPFPAPAAPGRSVVGSWRGQTTPRGGFRKCL